MNSFVLIAAITAELTLNNMRAAAPHQQVVHYAAQACAEPNLNKQSVYVTLRQNGWEKDAGVWTVLRDFWIKKTDEVTVRVNVERTDNIDGTTVQICQFLSRDASVGEVFDYVSAKIGPPSFAPWNEEKQTAAWNLVFEDHQAGFFLSPGVGLEVIGKGVMIVTIQEVD
ncbi:MAG: hypothetical protein AAGJ09_04095 [Pseudomonadota bacterium]